MGRVQVDLLGFCLQGVREIWLVLLLLHAMQPPFSFPELCFAFASPSPAFPHTHACCSAALVERLLAQPSLIDSPDLQVIQYK